MVTEKVKKGEKRKGTCEEGWSSFERLKSGLS